MIVITPLLDPLAANCHHHKPRDARRWVRWGSSDMSKGVRGSSSNWIRWGSSDGLYLAEFADHVPEAPRMLLDSKGVRGSSNCLSGGQLSRYTVSPAEALPSRVAGREK